MDQSSLTQYRNALLGANNIPTSTSNINVTPETAGAIGNLQNMYRGTFQAGAANAALGAAGGAAGAVANQQEADARTKLQEEQDKLAAAQQTKQDLTDPSKYQAQIKEDGGYDFVDPTGKLIDAKTYAAATGKHLTDVLKKSQNPADQEFVKNYGNVEKLGQIFQSGDGKARDKFLKQNPDVQSDYDQLKRHLGHDPTYGDIVSAFRQGYPQYFNTKSTVAPAATGYTDSTLPGVGRQQKASVAPADSGMSLLDRIKSIF